MITDSLVGAKNSKEVRRMVLYILYKTLHSSNSPPSPETKLALLKLRKALNGLL